MLNMKKALPKILGFIINTIGLLSPKQSAKIAMQLFSTPLKGKTKPHEQKYLNTAQIENINYNGLNIKTYTWPGNKDTILLAHGWESNSYRWKDLITHLNKLQYNVVAIDAPAHGSSQGKTFNAIMNAACINKIANQIKATVIIGHSMGGMSTVFALYKTPISSVKKIILLGAPSNFKGIFNRYTSMMHYSTKVKSAIIKNIQNTFGQSPEYFSAAEFSKQLDCKGLIIHDKEDRIIPYQDGLDFKALYKNGTLITTTGLGHGLKSDVIYNHIISFLKS